MNNDFNNSSKNNSNTVENFSNLFEKTYFSNINLIFYIDYLTYKKELIKNITNDIESIINFFNEEISDIIIKILILKKKNKITNNDYKIFESIFELINILNTIDFFDQEDFLNILLTFFIIKILTEQINIFFDSFQFNDLINIKIFTDGINELFNKISKNNIFLKTLFVIISTSNEKIILNEIKNIAKYISYDFFMYYDSVCFYNKLLNYTEKLTKILNYKSNQSEKTILYKLLRNNKKIFIDEYNYYFNKHLEIYSNYEFELKIKFKLKKKQNIIKLAENLKFISNFN